MPDEYPATTAAPVHEAPFICAVRLLPLFAGSVPADPLIGRSKLPFVTVRIEVGSNAAAAVKANVPAIRLAVSVDTVTVALAPESGVVHEGQDCETV